MSRSGHARSLTASLALASAAAAWVGRHRTSPAVRNWTPPRGAVVEAGPLMVRTHGEGDAAVVLMHGLTSSHLQWGGSYDVLGDHGRLVVPDLLGFGLSMDADGPYTRETHLEALDAMAAALGLDGCDIIVGAHSMGALLALQWAARRTDVVGVVCFCAPMYRSPEEADEHIADMGLLERFFAVEGPLARWTCAAMCRYRRTARWVAVAISPQWPVPVASAGVRHTWDSYLGGMDGLIRSGGWADALEVLIERAVPVRLAEGARDPVPVAGLAERLAAPHEGVQVHCHPDAGHDLPLTDPLWCLRLLAELS